VAPGYDAVVVGSGINGLVAAAELAGAGWRVCLVEANDRLGGFIASGELTEPGFVHDTYSSWHPLFVTGGAYAVLGEDLARHGLAYCNTEDLVTASVAADGRTTVAHRDPARTAARFRSAADGERYLGMLEHLSVDLASIGGLLGVEVRGPGALRPLAAIARRGRLRGLETWARDTASSGRAFARREFTGPEVDHLWAPWLLHAGLAPDSASGGLMIPLFAGTFHAAGLPVVRGGAGNLVTAFTGLLAERGVDLLLGSPVEGIVLDGGRAVGVQVESRTIRAERAVLASVTPGALYGQLLPAGTVDAATSDEAARYRYGRAAMQVHVALSAPPAWRDAELAEVPLVHLTDGSASTAIACAEAEAGLLPRRPTVVVGQQSVLDPTRVPAGGATLWLQLQELPFTPTGDAAGELDVRGGWTAELVEGYLDRVLGLLEAHAPGTRATVLGTAVLSPADLSAANRNAVRGDPYAGSAELDQNLLWRPGPRTGRHRTEVPGLWHIGASTHPGPGLGGGSGHLVAQALTRPRAARLQPVDPRRLLAGRRAGAATPTR
jgi:phytoene dehydrogenase-like protein